MELSWQQCYCASQDRHKLRSSDKRQCACAAASLVPTSCALSGNALRWKGLAVAAGSGQGDEACGAGSMGPALYKEPRLHYNIPAFPVRPPRLQGCASAAPDAPPGWQPGTVQLPRSCTRHPTAPAPVHNAAAIHFFPSCKGTWVPWVELTQSYSDYAKCKAHLHK